MNYIKCPKCGREEPAFDYAHVCGPVEVKRSVMNERIKDLAKQVLKHPDTDNDGLTVFDNDELEKFAELIVRECMEQVWYTREDGINGNVSQVIKDRIKEHFGVEE